MYLLRSCIYTTFEGEYVAKNNNRFIDENLFDINLVYKEEIKDLAKELNYTINNETNENISTNEKFIFPNKSWVEIKKVL